MEDTDDFVERVQALRPRLHRYCARMAGSAIQGEDILQDALVKALQARAEGASVDNLEAWLFRIAHNTSLDYLRERMRNNVVPLTEDDDAQAPPVADPHVLSLGFQMFLRLPELQRCAVILKDVMGHSVEEIAEIADCSEPAAKSALQRGRSALRQLAQAPDGTRLPLMDDHERRKIARFVSLFQTGDFDAIRAMLADDIQLELVNRLRLEGRERITPYFTRYAEAAKWRFALGAVEGQPVMLVFDGSVPSSRPAHFVSVEWVDARITRIRDFLFAPYVLEGIEWVRLG